MNPPPKDNIVLRIIALLFLLYLFLLSIGLLGASFKLLGDEAAKALFDKVDNPFLGLLIGILATSLVQSSSVTTSTVVGLVASGMPINLAVPIIMGANIGTTVTNSLVSLGHISRRDEFRRAFAGATVHDFFNIATLVVLFPIEINFHILERLAGKITGWFASMTAATGDEGMLKFTSPIKAITKPVVKSISHFAETHASSGWAAGGLAIIAAFFIFISLTFIVKVLRKLVVSKVESMVDKSLEKKNFLDNPFYGMSLGATVTALVQSSSITTSIMVPLAGAGVVTLTQIFHFTMGANIGTTVTSLLASSAANEQGFQIAVVHLLFNVGGIVLIYPIPFIRRIPLFCAEKMADLSAKHRWVPFVFIAVLFFVIPGSLIYLSS